MYLIRSGAIQGFDRLALRLGQNPVRLLQAVGFSSAQVRQPNAYVSYQKLATLLDIGAERCREPVFGLRLAADQNLLVIGALALSASQQPTLGDALNYTDQHLHLHALGSHLETRVHDDRVECHLTWDITNASGLQQLIQLSVGQLDNALRFWVANTGQQLKLHLRQGGPPEGHWSDTPYRGRMVFGSRLDGVSFPSAWLARKPRQDESLVRRYFLQHVEMLESLYPDNLQAQMRHVICNLLPSGECSIERVSAALDLRPRVLQTRLQAEGGSYRSVLRLTRMEIAQQQLLNSQISITDLALNLGYADVSVFSRHFRQWVGKSPRVWRKEQRKSSPSC